MKVIVDFPIVVSHINMWQCKRVRIKPDAVERYADDPRWIHQDQIERASILTLLSRIVGMECQVIMAWRNENAIMYGLLLGETVEAPNNAGFRTFHNKCQFPADYCDVLDSGFMEAR